MEKDKMEKISEEISAFTQQIKVNAQNGNRSDMNLLGAQFGQKMREMFAKEGSSKKRKKE